MMKSSDSTRKVIFSAGFCLFFLQFLFLSQVSATVSNGDAGVVLGQSNFIDSYPNVVSSGTYNAPFAASNYSNNPLFVVDRENSRIIFWRSPLTNPIENGQPADGVIGQQDFNSGKPNRGGGAGANTLNRPCGVHYNAAENAVWVADCGNNRLLRFFNPPNFGASADMVLGQADYINVAANRGGAVAANTLSNPTDVAQDYLSGDIWVADSGNNRVLKYACIYSAGCTFAANASLVVGQDNLNLATYPSTVSSKTVTGYDSGGSRLGITVDNGGNLWVADAAQNRVLKFTTPVANGSSATIVLGQADFNSFSSNRGGAVAANTLFRPSQVSVSVDQGVVWVADTYNYRVLKFTAPITNGASAALVLGQQDFTSALSGVSNMVPTGVFLPRSGTDLWVADYGASRLLKFSNPSVSGVAPDRVVGKSDFAQSGPNYVDGRGMSLPYGVVVDRARSRIFVSEYMNNRVLWWNDLASYTNGKPADGVLGQTNMYTRQGNRGLSAPQADTLMMPWGLAVDDDGNLWVADSGNNRILRFNGASLASGADADLVLGQSDFISKNANRGGGIAQNTLNSPAGVGVDAAGDIWVGDSLNNRVLKFSGTGLANGGNAVLVLGQSNFTSGAANRGGAAGQNTLSWPSAILCQNAEVWVLDGGNQRVLKFSAPASDGPNADMVLGQTTFSGTSIGAQSNKFCGVSNSANMSLDAFGNLWVPDQGGSRVLRFDPPFGTGMSASLVLGQANFTSCSENRGGTAGINTFKTPYGVAVDPRLNVYVSDSGNNRLLIFESGLAVTELAPTVPDTSDNSLAFAWTDATSGAYWAVLASDDNYSAIVSSVQVSGNTHVFSGLSANTSYYFQVKISTEIDGAYYFNRLSALTQPPPAPVILSVTPTGTLPQNPVAIAITGAGFAAGAVVKLTKTGEADISASLTTVVSASRLESVFDLSAAANGSWNLTLSVPGKPDAVYADALAVLPPVIAPARIYRGIFSPSSGDKSLIVTHTTAPGKVTVKVYDAGGRLVRDIFEGSRAAGDYSDEWDGRNADGAKVASGIYLIRIEGPGLNTTKRVLVVK